MSDLRQQSLQGFLGVPGTPKPGGVCEAALAAETKRQSGLSASAGRRSLQFRIRLPDHLGHRWTVFPPKLREKLAAVVFGAAIAEVDLAQLAAAASLLHQTGVALRQALLLAKMRGVPLDVARINAAVERIEALLGERP